MKLQDAAKILDLSGDTTPASVKKAYQRAASKYHPDRNPAGVEMMKAVNLAYETLKDFQGSLEQGVEGYADELNNVLNKIIELSGIQIEVCGAWIWVTGNTKPHAKSLGRKEGAGLFFASKKKAWYYRPSDWKSASRGSYSMDDIRGTHGSVVVGKERKSLTA